jgi:hypothetical protein
MDVARVGGGPPSVDLILFRVQRSRGCHPNCSPVVLDREITRVVILPASVTAADAEK